MSTVVRELPQVPVRLRGFIVPLALLLVWDLLTRFKLVNPLLVARPAAVLAVLGEQWREGGLVPQLLASLRRDLSGFALGSVAGIAVGSAMGLSRLADRLVGPTFNAAKQVAIFAWIPLISVWFGSDEPAKVVFISLSAFYPVVVSTFEGIRSVGREHVEVARVFRFTYLQIFRKVVLPGALPSIFAGLHLALVYSWLGTLGAEYLLAPGLGIGNLMIEGREQFKMDKVLLGVIIAGIIGFSLNALSSRLEARLSRWRVRPA
ncbi:MAG TPA: ABC transporter permease [Polyangiaceae bacterium]|nr:ABC transporter permease [Polyangiaceae bacterium]